MSRRTADIKRKAEAMGWAVRLTNGNHLRFDKPGHRPVFTSLTPGDCRSGKNALAKLRRVERQTEKTP